MSHDIIWRSKTKICFNIQSAFYKKKLAHAIAYLFICIIHSEADIVP